jgi:hypothetical protein
MENGSLCGPNVSFPVAQQPKSGLGRLLLVGFQITLRHSTLGRTPLDEWSARRRDLYLTTHNTHNRQTSMPLAGFETTIPASARPKASTSDRAATGIGVDLTCKRDIQHRVHDNEEVVMAVRK